MITGVDRQTQYTYMHFIHDVLIPDGRAIQGRRYPVAVTMAFYRGLITIDEVVEAIAEREGVTMDEIEKGW